MRLGFGNASAGMCVALLSPIVGALASAGKAKKQFLILFIALGVLMTAMLFLVPQGAWLWALAVFIFARIGFNIANLFYDAFLVDVADSHERDIVSSWGFGIGYLGCALLFIINLLMYKKPAFFGFANEAVAVRYIFLSAAVWWFLFSIPIVLFVHEHAARSPKKLAAIIQNGLHTMVSTMRAIRNNRNILLFLCAYWFYIDGVHTVVMMCADFGLSIGISMGTLMIALLCVQLVAFPSAIAFGFLSRIAGAKNVILAAVVVYTAITLGGAWMMKTGTHFIILACLTGSVQGAIQALSRSFFSKMIESEKATDYFGFYNMVGRFAIIIGPAIVALANLVVHALGLQTQIASRSGISALSVLFIIGGILLAQVTSPEAAKDS
jgi:UMF1 family MFS transporter